MTHSDDEALSELERLLALCEVQSVRSGVPLPLGAHRRGNGVNFALLSRNATGVRLDLFAHRDDAAPNRTIILDPARNKTGDIWHVWLEDIPAGQLYGYRVAGPYVPEQGHRFDPNKLLVDPYATAIALAPGRNFDAAREYDVDDATTAPRCVVTHDDFDWSGDQPLRRPWTSTVLYELHVRGATIHPSSGVACPGTYRGLVEKIGYLQDLGVTAVELMPILEFNEHECTRVDPHTGERLRNYWGYDPIGFFAPKASYASTRDPGAALLELKQMVRAFHQAGIEVLLDLVLNHTAEGDERGPTIGFRGIDNALYYWLAEDPRRYRDFTGTGHTIRASHPIVRDLVLDVLRYWVTEVHVDGFRIDLASVLGRDREGRVVADAPLLERIAEDPILRDTKLVAEAWDVAGAYQVGSFSQRRWAEWNGRFRDDVRRFWRGDAGMLGRFASRLAGSADLYEGSGKGPECSVNLVTCHDGFTLADLVGYAHKHNEANGEGNRDGIDDNCSANYGIEGPSDDPALAAVRVRQIKNFLLTLAVSRGVPMLLAGDELGRTQRGNNNAYCQDNETSWIDWSPLARDADVHRFARAALALRRAHPVLRREAFYSDRDITWLAPDGGGPRWSDPEARQLAVTVREPGAPSLCLLFNAAAAPCTFALPGGTRWQVALDTAGGTTVVDAHVRLIARSSAVLVA
ncbi:MAG TPA: glycogen debranching protein GlgX [Kofleriaceae bacterium]|nr:glycogen debranching protein GlgX [Kofleriaceae bacterium]